MLSSVLMKRIGSGRSSPGSRWRRFTILTASRKSDRSFIGAFLPFYQFRCTSPRSNQFRVANHDFLDLVGKGHEFRQKFFLIHLSRALCEGGGVVVGVTLLVGGVALAFRGDQVVELRVQLAMQEVEGKEEDRKGQVEVEEEKRLKEVRSWMTMEMK